MNWKQLQEFVIVFLIGLAMAGYAGYTVYEQQMVVHTAEPVEGTVVDSSTAMVSGVTGPGSKAGTEADVVYRYSYEGETYTSDVVFPAGDGSSPLDDDRARRLVDRYEPGSSVTVYVSTRDPSESYLVEETDFGPGQLLFLGLGSLLMAMVVYNAIWD